MASLRCGLVFCAAIAVILTAAYPAAALQTCGIGVSARPSQVSLPWGALPAPGTTTFGEAFDVNYSSSFMNQTLSVQYLNGTGWVTLQTFVGNAVGFTEVSYGLDRGWARLGANSVRVVGGTCSSNTAVFQVEHDPTAVLSDAAVYLAIAALGAGFILLGKRLGWKRFLILAVPVYLAVAPWTGQRYDVYFLLSSGIRILQHVNPFTPGVPPAYPGPLKWAYPPLYALYSAFSFLVYQGLTGASLPSVSALTWPGWLTSTYNVYLAYTPKTLPVLVSLLKLPMIASAIMTGALLARMTKSEHPAVWWVANPLVIVVAAVWGQLDPISVLLAVGALYYFQRGKEYHAYLLASFGAAVKVWPALLIPIMLVASLRREGRGALKPASAVLPAVLVTLGLYGVYGKVLNSAFVFLYARGVPTFAGAFSVNGLTWQEVLLVLRSPPYPLFLWVGIPAYVAMLAWMYWKGDTDVLKWGVVSIMILFLTYNYVNPQYFCWVLPFLLLQRKRISALVFTALPLVYMAFSYNLFYFWSPASLPNEFAFGAAVVEQFKVNFFYGTPAVFVLVSAVLPTAAYVLLLYEELGKRGSGSSGVAVSVPEGGVARRP